MIDLGAFDLGSMLEVNRGLTEACRGVGSQEQLAGSSVRWLRENLRARGETACVLARFYRLLSYSALPASLQRFASRVAPSKPETRCLTLLGTAGELADWNDRTCSNGHQAIPLVSRDFVERAPMLSQLFVQFGIRIEAIVSGREALLDASERQFNVFHVEDARGSSCVPAQRFVEEFGVQSVLGVGATLPDDSLFAIILFLRTKLARATAQMFRPVPLTLKATLLRSQLPVFGR